MSIATKLLGLLVLSVPCLVLAPEATGQLPQEFGSHWFQGKAEVNTYRLEQSRYGETRQGKAILVFVTEDFDPKALVKNEDGRGPSVGILKLNQIRRFTTGIYDYSMMMSVFTRRQPGEGPQTLKTTHSVQDWCGHAWLQLDREDDTYRLTGHSYFERENQQSAELPGVLLEDEVLVRLRLGPDAMPTGKLRVIPSGFDSRLRHYLPRAEQAEATMGPGEKGQRTYQIKMDSGRSLTVRFGAEFPHRILMWEERMGGTLMARATLEESQMQAYWGQNREADTPRRTPLGLPANDL